MLDGQPHTAAALVITADRSDSTIGSILARLSRDGHLDSEMTERKSVALPGARPVRAYRLTEAGTAYARTVLGVGTSASAPETT
jgi:DNA-binding PadR family transcriptional regulator